MHSINIFSIILIVLMVVIYSFYLYIFSENDLQIAITLVVK